MPQSARQFERINAAVPVQLEGGLQGQTLNLSPTGVFFVIDADVESGKSIHFTLEFDNPGGKLYLDCVAEVVRTEKADGKLGVAAKIIESRLERRNAALG